MKDTVTEGTAKFQTVVDGLSSRESEPANCTRSKARELQPILFSCLFNLGERTTQLNISLYHLDLKNKDHHLLFYIQLWKHVCLQWEKFWWMVLSKCSQQMTQMKLKKHFLP